jgi:hypothetical protein
MTTAGIAWRGIRIPPLNGVVAAAPMSHFVEFQWKAGIYCQRRHKRQRHQRNNGDRV